MSYEIKLPWPPSVNQWKSPFKGRMILTKKGRDYRKEVHALMDSYGISNEMISDRLRVTLYLTPPTARKFDIDNFCKSPFDALTTCGFWLDDELIDELRIKKMPKSKGGSITLKIESIEQ